MTSDPGSTPASPATSGSQAEPSPLAMAEPSRLAMCTVVYAFAVVMLGTTLPTPLYSIYATQMHFGVVTTSAVFAVYAAGVICALLCFGRLSDVVGRRRLLLAGGSAALVSSVVFLLADTLITAQPVGQLMVGRFISGLSAGIYAAAATPAIIELAPSRWRSRAPAIATAANIGGLGLGPLLAGVLAEYAPAPLRVPFAVHIVLLTAALVAVWSLTEHVATHRGTRLRIQRLSVPPSVRAPFLSASIAAFAGFAVMGTFTGLIPSLLSGVLGIDDHAVTGGLVAVLFASSALAQILGRRIATDTASVAGCVLLVVGVGVLALGIGIASLPALFTGAVIAGIGQGLSFSRGLAHVVELAPPDRRAEVTAAYFVVAYVAISLPILGQGVAASVWGLVPTGLFFNAAVGLLAVIALTLTLITATRTRRTARPD